MSAWAFAPTRTPTCCICGPKPSRSSARPCCRSASSKHRKRLPKGAASMGSATRASAVDAQPDQTVKCNATDGELGARCAAKLRPGVSGAHNPPQAKGMPYLRRKSAACPAVPYCNALMHLHATRREALATLRDRMGERVMRISIGGIFSKCPQCGCEEFARQPGEKAESKVLECCVC